MATITFPAHAPAALGQRPSLAHRVLDTLALWTSRSNGRAALAQMNPAELKDIGLTIGEAEWEVNKAPWQA